MKILELRFKNLNSLYGEWIIDFTDPEYLSNGIFALTGPTGAGKSTILDAICLAFYGATPRLGKITKSGNEIMSRQTGECYAEVLFESQAGRFRCHWEQRRARKKADGKLQDQEHQIADGVTDKLIETKKSLVAGVIEEKTGMDFDRFTRSILLAQGGFDTFLKADVEQKSKILEQITGTEIYSAISTRVHERQRDERDKLNNLNLQTSGIVVLEPEQEREIQSDLTKKREEATALAKKTSKTGDAIKWLTHIETLKNELLNLADEDAKLKADTEAFKPERIRLERAVKAASLDGTYATLTSLRKQQGDDQTALKTDAATLPDLEASANAKAIALTSAEQFTATIKKERTTAAPLIQKIRSMDQKIAEQTEAISKSADECAKEVQTITTHKHDRVKEYEKRSTAQQTLEAAEQYLRDNERDEWLIGGLAGVETQVQNLLAKQRDTAQKEYELEQADTAIANAAKTLTAATKQCELRQQELDAADKTLQQGKEALNRLLGDKLLREYRNEKETLLREMALIRKIEELEEQRAKLEDGEPCPLCGSREHPFAEGNVPVPDETEQRIESLTTLIDKAEKQEADITKLEQAKNAARDNLYASERRKIEASASKKAAEKKLADLTDNLTNLRADFDELKLAVSENLKPLGITEIPETEVESLLDSLRSRQQTWRAQVSQKSDIEKHLAAIDSEISRLGAVIDTHEKALADKQKTLENLNEELAHGTAQRHQLYGDKHPDDEERQLNENLAEAETAETQARDLHIALQQKLTTAKTRVDSLKTSVARRTPELKKAEEDFSAALTQADFTEEDTFLKARLSQQDRQVLSSRANAFEKAGTELQAKETDRKARLTTELAKKVTDKTLEDLQLQSQELEENLTTLRETVAGLEHQLNENTVAKERIKEKQSAIDAQKRECHRWEKLHGLIGSADGKKYRNFAQGLTFELMVSHANRQLEKMTDRYLLIRDDQQPLELNVIDSYQAGEIRSTKNLSGGESFIISLTLALGLSKMASRNVRVDSLFLDEGFGTLDEDALETALETLSGLHQDGKLIGIISHVSALKERISTQISVTPQSSGRSSLFGPGCTKMVRNQ